MKIYELTDQEKESALDAALFEKIAGLERKALYQRFSRFDKVTFGQNFDYILGQLEKGLRP